jgi:hypothetical protein
MTTTTIQPIPINTIRLPDEHQRRVRLGLCVHIPRTTFCERLLTEAERAAGQIECAEHERLTCEQFEGSPILRLNDAARQQVGKGYFAAVDQDRSGRRIIRATRLTEPGPPESAMIGGPYWSMRYVAHGDLAAEGVWFEVAPALSNNIGLIDGVEDQAGEAWARRYARPLADGSWAFIEDSYYPHTDQVAVNRFVMRVCWDLRDPAGTEVRSLITVEPVDEPDEPTAERLRALCDMVDPAAFHWDGALSE